MPEINRLHTVLSNTYTKDDVHRRIAVLKEFLEHRFYDRHDAGGEEGTLVDALARHARENAGEEAVALRVAEWGDAFLQSFSANGLYDQMSALTTAIEELPGLVVYAPVALSDEHAARIGTWCRANIREGLMLDVKVDPSAAGGCALVWNGVYHDFSLTYFAHQKRDAIRELVHEAAP